MLYLFKDSYYILGSKITKEKFDTLVGVTSHVNSFTWHVMSDLTYWVEYAPTLDFKYERLNFFLKVYVALVFSI